MQVFESLTIGKKFLCLKVILGPGTDVKLWQSKNKQLKAKGWKDYRYNKQGTGSYESGVGKSENSTCWEMVLF